MTPAGSGRSTPRWLLFLVFLAWPAVLVAPTGSSMSDSVLRVAIRLVEHGTWTLSDERDPGVVFLTEAFDISVREGRVYSGVGPGASAVAAPLYFAARPLLGRFDERVIANRRFAGYYAHNRRVRGMPSDPRLKDIYLLQILLAWVVTAPLLASLATRIHHQVRGRGLGAEAALATASAVALGSMALYYSATYSRPAVAYGLAWHGILSLLARPTRPVPGQAACLAAGALLGTAVATDYASLLLVALAVAFLLPPLPVRARVLVLLPLLVVLGATAWYHVAAFGSPLATPYHFRFWPGPAALPTPGLDLAPFRDNPALSIQAPRPEVMLRLLFGPYKGLLVYSPVLALGLAGHLAGLRRPACRRFHAWCLTVFGAYLMFNGTLGPGAGENARLAWGGLSVLWGPRHLYAVIPFLAAGLVALDWRAARWRMTAYALLAVSCALNVLGAMFSDIVMSTPALGPQLESPLSFAAGLLQAHGPRVPLLHVYGVAAWVQSLVLTGLVALSLACARLALRERSALREGPA